MLQNRIYRGEIVHKDKSYPGEHTAIVDAELWAAVQAILAANRVDRETGADAAEPSLLAGLLFDEAGERMTPTHANKKGTPLPLLRLPAAGHRNRGGPRRHGEGTAAPGSEPRGSHQGTTSRVP